MADIGKLVVAIGADTQDLEKGMGKAQGIVSGFTGKLGGLASAFNPVTLAIAAATAAAAALAAGFVALGAAGKTAFDFANQVDGSMKKLQAQLGATDQEMKGLKQSALNVFGKNFGNDINDVAEGMALVKQQIKGIDEIELESITKGVFSLRDTFEVSLPEGVDAVNTLMRQFGLTSAEALDFVTAGFQRGLNSSDDFVDTIREYSNLFGESGASAGQFFSILETGLQGGVLGTDKVADLFKEFSIRIVDGSKLTGDSLTQLGLDAQTLYDQINAGSLTTSEAFLMILDDLKAMDNQVLANQIGVGLFGTQFEDLGASAVLAIDTTKTSLDSLAGASDSLSVQYDTLASTWERLKRQALVSLLPIGDILLNSLKMAMPQIQRFFDWFKTTALPWINQFVTGASDILLKFFGNFDSNFGPALRRLWDSLLRVGEAFGIATGSDGAAGMEMALGILEKGLNIAVLLFDGLSRVVETQSRIWGPFITILRTVYELVRDIVNLLPGLIGSGLFAASGGKTFQELGFRAKGGPVSGGKPYMVGEKGPELFTPGRSGRVVPADALEKARAATKKWWSTSAGKAYAATKKQPKVKGPDIAKQNLEKVKQFGATTSFDKLGGELYGQLYGYSKDVAEGYFKQYRQLANKDPREAYKDLLTLKAAQPGESGFGERYENQQGQGGVTHQKNFYYSPTYNGVSNPNPEQDYYLINSLAG